MNAMKNRSAFEEAAFNTYVEGMLDYISILEQTACEMIDDVYELEEFQAIIDSAKAKFEALAK